MEIIAACFLVGAVMFGLGVLCGKNSPCSCQMHVPAIPIFTYSELDFSRQRVKSLEEELDYVKRSCRRHHQPPFLGCDNCPATKVRYYAQTVDEQRMADMLSKAKNTASQLVKDLRA